MTELDKFVNEFCDQLTEQHKLLLDGRTGADIETPQDAANWSIRTVRFCARRALKKVK